MTTTVSPAAMADAVFTNARIVLPDEVLTGTVSIRDGLIADVSAGPSRAGEDFGGDWLLPGLVELHTDHLESHYAPRPGVRWNPLSAVQAHDAQIAASGITTVFDALRIGTDFEAKLDGHDMRRLADAIEAGVAGDRLRADHFIHLRCEVGAPDSLEAFALFEADPRVRLASLMDHTPGQRQFASLEHWRAYYQAKNSLTDAAFEEMLAARIERAARHAEAHRQAIAERCRAAGIVIASHDDATAAHVAESIEHGVAVAEFPTTLAAAEAARAGGLSILMGAPNVVRGGSHTGNVSASDLAAAGLLDILSSDYVPFSLIHGAFLLTGPDAGLTVPDAIALVSRNPAEAVGLTDRGAILPGRRGDVIRVRLDHEVPLVRGVWRTGRRVS
ncbi:alpha-D-ribose 1-methylphosphonate 5-triphosphate diphosphatase [Methylobrevis albus]|uniref:Alpha-D-ribose 1-methylphosphonate 5-triphosphate diphosphatase n=1 Tax=Methylobrevis albus TaxID=2793297 RepID=A0A931I336_9HYPH|nr:alpha-D-ribose 1-methylphosphonate 5-triphosphate diphosphatase [Methylobrevis albus]MBH0238559.1 alpha-D-ribose 1-methylphosphonate 5-triphosphate diphosphatase [Methylobrevis albus]